MVQVLLSWSKDHHRCLMSVYGHCLSNSTVSARRKVGVNSVDSDEDCDVESDDDDERHDTVRDEFEVLEDVRHEEIVLVGIAGQS